MSTLISSYEDLFEFNRAKLAAINNDDTVPAAVRQCAFHAIEVLHHVETILDKGASDAVVSHSKVCILIALIYFSNVVQSYDSHYIIPHPDLLIHDASCKSIIAEIKRGTLIVLNSLKNLS